MVPVHVGTTVDEAERLLILRTLEATGQNKTRAAEILGVSLKTLHNKLKEYSRARKDTARLSHASQDQTRSGHHGSGVSHRRAVSLVYASQLLHAAVQQSYDTNHMVAEQIRFALQNALETGLRDQTVDPNDPGQLRALMTEAVRDNAELQAVVESVNRYSLTVYDINIGDSHSITLLSTNPENEDKPLPVRPDYNSSSMPIPSS